MDLLTSAIIEYYGIRCPEYNEYCDCCRAWKEYDSLLRDSRELAALNAGGVDNWEAYHESLKSAGFREDDDA